MPEPAAAPPTLSAEEAARLTDFARACKAAARVVVLYPATHPAIAATLGRIVQLTGTEALHGPMTITVMPDGLLLEERAPARPDAAIAELATLLHSHLIGQLKINPGGDVDAWRTFLLLLGRSPESVRDEGGIGRVWTTLAGRHVELREIDYAEVLRERDGGHSAVWEQVVANCLQGSAFDLDAAGIQELLGIAMDPERLAELVAHVDGAVDASSGISAKAAAIVRLLRGIVEAVSKTEPQRLEPILRNMSAALGEMSAESLMALIEHRDESEGPQIVQAVVSRMTDRTISKFVARQVVEDGSATDRLAQAFQTLVPGEGDRERLLGLAREDAEATSGGKEGFAEIWNQAASKLITSYSDKTFVSEAYGRELSLARTQALQVEQVSDDPPERISTWLGTIATSALRSLDLTLLLDLLRIERDDERWASLLTPVGALLDDLLLVGDFDAALALVQVIGNEASPDGQPDRRPHAVAAIDRLVAGPMLRHVTTHLGSVDDGQFDRIKQMCLAIGVTLVRPLAEALSTEERTLTRERLTTILVSFGAGARPTIERLKNSQNPAVRRTAISLMRQFAGSEALPDLKELLDDSEPLIQREAVRAIITIGTDPGFRIIEQAITGGTAASRDAIMQTVTTIRDERAAPVLAYILRHIDHRGPLRAIYLKAIESLGSLKHPAGVAALQEVLHRSEWWAPRRTAAMREAAATALARMGTPEAVAVLEEAVGQGSRGVRAIARTQLAAARARLSTGARGSRS